MAGRRLRANDILTKLRETAQSRIAEIPLEGRIIRGVWHVNYALKLTDASTTLHLNYVVVQTLEQGCSYYERDREEAGLNESFLGVDAMDLSTGYRCWDIAALDAVYAHLVGSPDEEYQIEGSNVDKATLRAEIVCREALSVLERLSPKDGKKYTVANVGVVGDFLAILSSRSDIKLVATDFYRGIVKKRVFGTTVKHGSMTSEVVAQADLAIVTGMTLANGTLSEILETARQNQTALVIFAETGSHFASEYCRLGIDVVVSEPLPFYLTGSGPTFIRVYRARNRRS